MLAALTPVTVIAAEESGGGNFLVTPSVGLMVWTLIAFGATWYILAKLAFPRIQEALGVLTLPFGVILFLFEVGLVATLQAFIFATLTAIYLGGAVAEHH